MKSMTELRMMMLMTLMTKVIIDKNIKTCEKRRILSPTARLSSRIPRKTYDNNNNNDNKTTTTATIIIKFPTIMIKV